LFFAIELTPFRFDQTLELLQTCLHHHFLILSAQGRHLLEVSSTHLITKKAADTFFSNASTASQLRFRILFSMADRLLFCFFLIPDSAVIFHIYTDLYRSVRFSFAQEAHGFYPDGLAELVYAARLLQAVSCCEEALQIPGKTGRLARDIHNTVHPV